MDFTKNNLIFSTDKFLKAGNIQFIHWAESYERQSIIDTEKVSGYAISPAWKPSKRNEN